MTRAALCNLLVTEAEAIKKSAKEDRPRGKQDDPDPPLAAILDAIRIEEFFKNFDPRVEHAPYLTVR